MAHSRSVPMTVETHMRWVDGRGYRVIHFWNNDVLPNTEGC
jgi:hypothetical protein